MKDQEEHPKAKTNKYNKAACSECNSLITEINIKRYMLNVHDIDTAVCGICVDQNESIFMVRHNPRGKVNSVHYQMKIQGQNTNVMCEVTDCINAIQDATRSNINHFECTRIKSISKSIGHQQTNQLKDDDLENVSSSGQFYMFSDTSIANLKTIREECLESNTVPTVQFPCEEDSRFWFFSVVSKDEENKYYA